MAAFEAIFNVLVTAYCQSGDCMHTHWVEQLASAYILAQRVPSSTSVEVREIDSFDKF